MKTLDELAKKHGTDKVSSHHNYTPYYEKHFEPMRDKQIKLLEIGVKEGCSVRMWQDYFPLGQITGIDKNPACVKHAADRIDIVIADQGDRDAMLKVGVDFGKFDIIIDDGSHHWSHQVNCFKWLSNYLADGGLYIIEDLHTSYGSAVHADQQQPCTEYLYTLVDDLHKSRNKKNPPTMFHEIQFYRCMCVLTKKWIWRG